MGENERGSATIELSIFITVICGLIFGYMALMNGINTSIALQVAAREGARSYATTESTVKAKYKANQELSDMGVTNATLETSIEGTARSVLVKKAYNFSIPLFGTYTKTLKGYCIFETEPIFNEGE